MIKKMARIQGTLFGRAVQTKVDHELAKTILTNPNDSAVVQFFSDYSNYELNTETLAKITREYSIDVATLFFIKRVYEQDKNRRAQDYYLSGVHDLTEEDIKQQIALLKRYYIVFVPGFQYECANNGGDFLDQRAFLDTTDISYEMIMLDEVGLVESNAKMIADRLQELCTIYSDIVVISVSKGGLETAIALDKISEIQNISSIKFWINVCGTLKGTPLADFWLQPLRRIWMSCILFFSGQKVNLKRLLNDMSYESCKERYKSITVPPEIVPINLIGVPLGRDKRSKMAVPNDTFSPSPDSIAGDGAVIVEIDSDHYFKEVDMNKRMMVVLKYISEL